jgi:hypothetical protein
MRSSKERGSIKNRAATEDDSGTARLGGPTPYFGASLDFEGSPCGPCFVVGGALGEPLGSFFDGTLLAWLGPFLIQVRGERYQAHSLSLTLTTPGRLLPGRSDSVREARVADVEASTNGC